jgi:glyoxylase-like metal-dependent hydrolase (beta-lactamase superfamily II)
MRVHHLNCATLCPLGGRHTGGEGGILSQGKLVCHCLLIEGPSGLVLVDTGIGQHDIDRPARLGPSVALLRARLDPAETAIAQVRALGFAPEDVRDIVLTHLDLDHAGALADFPWATVHLLDREYQAVTAPSLQERLRYRSEQWAHGPAWYPHRVGAEGGGWFGLTCVRELDRLPPEILLVPLIGHSRGHAGVAVDTGPGGWLLHAGDAYFSRFELEPGSDQGRLLRGFESLVAFDNRLRRASRELLRGLVSRHGREVRVFCAHDPVEFERLRA